MDWMGRRTSRGEAGRRPSTVGRAAASEAGFTLAGVMVILSVMLIFLAYTVPRQWSAIMQREREQQTIYAMQQYARACFEFQRKNNTYPVNPSQLKEARTPRMIRGVTGEIVDPLTGQYDWLVITQAQAASIPANGPPGSNQTAGPGFNPSGQNPNYQNGQNGVAPQTGTTGTNPSGTPTLPGVPIKDYAGGPFVGVRPPVSGKAMITLNGNETYETWSYTALDLNNDIQRRMAGLSIVYK
jgi:type II secretory pathway pseudopilin PulG